MLGRAWSPLGFNPGGSSDLTEVSLLLNQANVVEIDEKWIKKQNKENNQYWGT